MSKYQYYELSNHLEDKVLLWKTDASSVRRKSRRNVLTVINDEVIPTSTDNITVDGYQVGIVNIADYSPFGMLMPGRNEQAEGYRYGFQGQELDDEIKGIKGSSYDYGARMYDSRIGRWFSVDKLHMMAPGWSTYRSFYDNPIYWGDSDGNLEWPLKGKKVGNKKNLPGGRGEKDMVVRTSTYREIRSSGSSPHIGIDYRASIGTAVYSLGDGDITGMSKSKSGIVILEVTYNSGDVLRFLHLSKYADGLKVGDKVSEGQIIAYSGNTGKYWKNGKYINYAAHLHVDAVDKNGKTIDPEGKNYGVLSNEEFFGEYEGDYTKTPAQLETQKLYTNRNEITEVNVSAKKIKTFPVMPAKTLPTSADEQKTIIKYVPTPSSPKGKRRKK